MKKNVLWALLDLVFLAVFNAVFFILGGFEHPTSVWLSYGFIHFAYLMIVITPFLNRKGSNTAIFGFSIQSISSVYFFVEFIAGLIFIIIRSESIKAALVAQAVIASIYAIVLFSNLIANEHTGDAIDRKEEEVAYIKTASSRIKALVGKNEDRKATKAVEKAYDALHASPTKSNDSLKSLETQILYKVTQLEESVYSNDVISVIALSGEIVSLVESRNRKLRLSN